MADFLMLYIEVLGVIIIASIASIVVLGLFAGVSYAYVTLEDKLSEDWAFGGTALILLILLPILLTFLIHFGGGAP